MSEVHVIAVIECKPGQRDAVLTAFRENMPAVHAEAGCLAYEPTTDVEISPAKFGDDTFVVIERWESAEHLEAHRTAPHMVAYGNKVKDMLADRKIHVLSAT